MPAIALVGAAASVSAGLGAVAAAGGMAAMSFGAALAAGASIAGGIMTGLGAITGNKKLLKVGAIVGLAGGIGTAMSGTSNAAASGINSVGGEGVFMGSAAGNAGSNAVELGLTEGLGGAASSGLEATTSAVMPQSGIIGNAIAPPGSVESFFGEVPMAEAGRAGGPAGAPLATTQQTVKQIADTAGSDGLTPILDANGRNLLQGSDPLRDTLGRLKGFGKGALEFVQNKDNAGLLKVGGGLVQGAMGSYDKQRMYDQQLAQQEAERQRFNRSIIGSYVNR